jgi:zinc-ribbon domain
MFCSQCGKEIPEGKAFCPKCGAKQPGAQTTPPAQPPGGTQPQYQQTPPPQQQIPLPSPVMRPPGSPSGRRNLWIVLSIVGVVMIIAAVIIVAVLLLGGGNTSKAKEYLLNGDKLTKQLKVEAQTWNQELSSSMSNASDVATYQAGIDKAKAGAANLSRTAGDAKAEFEKIKGLSGVENYVKVADLQITEMENFQELMTNTNVFLDKVLALVKSGDVAGLESLGKTYADEAGKIVAENKKLDEEAQKIVTDNKLL